MSSGMEPPLQTNVRASTGPLFMSRNDRHFLRCSVPEQTDETVGSSKLISHYRLLFLALTPCDAANGFSLLFSPPLFPLRFSTLPAADRTFVMAVS